MSETGQILESIINNFSVSKFIRFFREKSRQFVTIEENLSQYNDVNFQNGTKIGEINFTDGDKLVVCSFEVKKELSERAGKHAQYQKAKEVLRSNENQNYLAGIFIYYDQIGNFRFSLIYPESFGTRRQWNNFRRFTYFVSKEFTNKTFLKQIGENEFTDLNSVKSSFSVTAVTDLFYNEFFKIYEAIVSETKKINKIIDEEKIRDFVLLFTIRSIFIGFIQRRKWIGNDEKFIQNFILEYKENYWGTNKFYLRWLTPLFFEALNSQKGSKVAYHNNDFSDETDNNLQMAPYLNGGLFKPKPGYDDNGWYIPDKEIKDFYDFLFSHSFTIEENSLEDEDLQLNPEFLGIIFERLVNKADGAVYTPRTEVDLMCRLSLVKWLQKNTENIIRSDNLYELFFRESQKDEDQKQGSFSQKEAVEILAKLESLSICDPAVGSGAFLVGMMQVLDEVEQILKHKYNLNGINIFERKKQIIKNSLYGVEVKEWAVWICQLRLWLSLFVDAPDDLKNSLEPILPSLDFKVRQGDSLVQRVGSKAFPVSGHLEIQSNVIKSKITQLKNLKVQYFDNKTNIKDFELKQKEVGIYKQILDKEIEEKGINLRILKNSKPVTQQSFIENNIILEQSEYLFNKIEIEELEIEINNLVEQKRALHSGNKPLVWGIEFAEVFAEKDGFDIIIGNPPYVRQEAISDPTGKIKDKKEYKNYLQEMVKLDFPNDFSKNNKINAQSDLYTYFYIRGLRLLNPKGIHTFICSNSWLDVGYGVWLQEFLLNRCPVELIIDNHAKRSFGAADVNTIISIIHAPQKKVDINHFVKLVAFKKPFEESIYTENMLAIENAKIIESNNIFRVYPITIKDLKESGTEYANEEQKILGGKYIGDKWGGKYLRAPDIYWNIINKGKNDILKLKQIGDVRYPIKTGINEFFYINKQNQSRNIEGKFLLPIAKSSKEFNVISPNKIALNYNLFCCNLSKEELSTQGLNGALNYILWGESQKTKARQKTKAGTYWRNVASVQGRKFWYSIEEIKPADVICNRFVNERFFYGYLDYDVIEDQTFYGITLLPQYIKSKLQIAAILNSTISILFTELLGRIALGEGILQYARYEMSNNIIYFPKAIKESKRLADSFDKLRYRTIKTVFEECGIDPKSEIPIEEQEPKPMEDRAELDKIIFDALDLSEVEQKDVYRAVCRLVWNRISKAKSV